MNNPYQRLISLSNSATSVQPSAPVEYVPHPAARKVCFHAWSDDDGVMTVEVMMSSKAWVELAVVPVAASVLTSVAYDLPYAKFRVSWQASAATGSVLIDAAYLGYGGSVA